MDDGITLWLWQGWWPRGEDGELEPAERNAGTYTFISLLGGNIGKVLNSNSKLYLFVGITMSMFNNHDNWHAYNSLAAASLSFRVQAISITSLIEISQAVSDLATGVTSNHCCQT